MSSVIDILRKYGSNSQANNTNAWNSPAQRQQSFAPQTAQSAQPNLAQRWQMSQRNSAGTITGQVQKPTQQEFLSRYVQTPEFKPTKAPTLQEEREKKWDALPDWQKKLAKDLNPYNAAELNRERDTIDANLKNAQSIVNAINGNPGKFAGNADAKQAYDWARDYLNGGAKLRDELSYMKTDEDYKAYKDSQQKSIETYERRANLDLDKAKKDVSDLYEQQFKLQSQNPLKLTTAEKQKLDQQLMDITQQIKELEDDIAYVEHRKENEEKYRSLEKNADFGAKAQYSPKQNYDGPASIRDSFTIDDLYELVNGTPGAETELSYTSNLAAWGIDDKQTLKYMTDEERAIFNYLYEQDRIAAQKEQELKAQMTDEERSKYVKQQTMRSPEEMRSSAENYLAFLAEDLNERARYADMKQAREYAKERPFEASVFSVVTSPLKTVTYLMQAADALSGQGLDQNAQYNKFSYMNTAVRDQVAKDITRSTGSGGAFAYQTAMSMADNLWQSLITGAMASGLVLKEAVPIAEHAMLAIMSMGAAADSVIAAKDRGLSDGQAFALGTAAGAVEYATEKIGIDRLFASLEQGESFAKAMLANALAEGGEEVLGNVMNEVLDFVIAGMDSERMQRIKELMDQGYTESQAAGIAFGEFGLETLKEGASGALSGAAFGGGTGVVSYVSSSAYYASVANNAQNISMNALNPEGVAGGFNWNTELQKGLAAPKNSKVYRTAQIAQRQVERTGNINSVTYGKLITEIAGDIRDKYIALNALDRADVLTDEERRNWQLLRDHGGIQLSSDLSTWSGTSPYIWQVQTAAYEALNKYYDEFTAKHETEFKEWQETQKNKIVTAYTDAGVSYDSASDIEEIIDKLVLGEYVTEAQIDKLRLTDPKYADLFYQVTGVNVNPSENIYVQAGQARNAIPPAELNSLEEAHLAREALNAQPTTEQTVGEAPIGGAMAAPAESVPAESVPAESATPAPQPNLSGETALSVATPTALAVQPSNALPAVGERTSVNRARLEQPTGRTQTEARIRGVQNRISELTAEGEQRRSAREAEQFRIARLSDDLFKARQDVAAAKKELADLKKDYEDTLRDMADLELRADRALRGNAKPLTRKEQADLYELQRHWEDDLADYDDQVEQLEQKVAELSKVLEAASGEYYAAANNMTIDPDVDQNLRTEIRDLNLELARLESELEFMDNEEAKRVEENIDALDTMLRLNDYLDDVVYDENGTAMDYDEYAESIRNDPDSEGMTDADIAESFMQLADAIQEAEAEAVRSYTASSIAEQDALVDSLNERLGTENEFHMADDNALLDNPELVANGVYDDKTGNIYFSRDLTTQQILQWTLAHELLHQAKVTTDGAIVDDVLDTMLRMNSRGLIEGGVKVWLDNYDEWFNEQAKLYRELNSELYADTPMGRSNVREELAAQLMRLVLPQTKFWNNLAQVKTPLLLRLYTGIQTRSRANDAYTKAVRRLAGKMETALHLTEEQKQTRYERGRNATAAENTPDAPSEAEADNEEAVAESYSRYSLNYATIDYARKHTGLSESSEVAVRSIYRLAELQKQIGKTIRKELPQGHWRMNIHNMNEYLAKHHEVWQELLDIQDASNKAGVPIDFVTPIQDSWELDGKEVEAGLKGFPIEYVTKEDGGYKFNGFARTLSQLYIDHMADSARWKLQDEMIAAVEDAYEKKISVADPTPQLSKMLKAVIGPTEIRNIGSKTKLYAQTALRSAKKTVAALNLNSACPMFTVGNHGCYFDACYLTQMGSGGNTVNLFQSAIYTGEILQLTDKAIETLNRDPDGLRVNGVGDTVAGNKGAFFAVLRHAAMRGLKLKIITKQKLTLDLLREAANRGIDISRVSVQLSMDNVWVPVALDDAWGSGIRGNVQIANTIERFNAAETQEDREYRATAIESAYGDEVYGRAVTYKNADTGESYGVETRLEADGVWYRKYGFTDEQVKELIGQYPEVTILPRYVVCTAEEIAELALGNGALGEGPFIQTLMHGVVPKEAKIKSEYAGDILNFGALRHVVEKNNGVWEFYGARVSKDKSTGKVTVTRQNSKAHAAVDSYIKEHYTPEQQETIYENLQKQLCCKASENIDACAGCASLFAGGCSLCQAVRAKKNQNYAPNPELNNPYEDKPIDLRSLAEKGETLKFSIRGEQSIRTEQDRANFETAQQMYKDAGSNLSGDAAERIRLATGWFRQSDGKWRKEFSSKSLKFKPGFEKIAKGLDVWAKYESLIDSAEKKYLQYEALEGHAGAADYDPWEDTNYNPENRKLFDEAVDLADQAAQYQSQLIQEQRLNDGLDLEELKLSDIIDWPELFEYYPQLKDMDVWLVNYLDLGDVNLEAGESLAGAYSRNPKLIQLARRQSSQRILGTLTHEIQHAIQDIEGYLSDDSYQGAYEEDPAEIEAYDAQNRRTWTDEQRKATAPKKFSIAGKNAATADLAALDRAIKLEQKGKSAQEIFRYTHWFKDPASGKWQFEINDSPIRFVETAEAGNRNDPQYEALRKEYRELKRKSKAGELTEDEKTRYEEVKKQYLDTKGQKKALFDAGGGVVGDVIKHDALFAAYPQLRNVKFTFEHFDSPTLQGQVSTNTITGERTIQLRDTYRDPARRDDMLSVMLHEMQHMIQGYEDFPSGGNKETMQRAQDRARRELTRTASTLDAMDPLNARAGMTLRNRIDSLFALGQIRVTDKDTGALLATITAPTGPLTDPAQRMTELNDATASLLDELKNAGYITEQQRRGGGLTTAVSNYIRALVTSKYLTTFNGRSASNYDIYQALRGEQQSRQTQDRRRMTAKERYEHMPSMPTDYRLAENITGYLRNGDITSIQADASNVEYSAEDTPANAEAIQETIEKTGGTLYSGGGTVDWAVANLINSLFAVEYNAKISSVYLQNNKTEFMGKDIKDFDPTPYAGKLFWLHASPVCKTYSTAISKKGKQKRITEGIDYETAVATAKAIRVIQPKVFTLENVVGYRDAAALKVITDALDELGYDWDRDMPVYNAADYGAATTRKRMIIRAVKDGKLPAKPTPTHTKGNYVSWGEAVGDYLDQLQPAKTVNPRMIDSLTNKSHIDLNNLEKPLLVFGESAKNGQYGHAYIDQPAPTIVANSGASRIFMPDGRILDATPRVLAKISGLSDDYTLPKAVTTARTIIGNGVPVPLTQAVIGPMLAEGVKFSISPKMQAKLDAQLAKYGAQKQSSRDARDVQIPNKVDVKGETRTVSRTPRTVANAQPITEDSADKIRSYIVNGKFTYLPTTHKTLTDNADQWIRQHGWVESVRLFLNDVQQGRVSGELTARGALLLNNASNGSDEKTFLKLLNGYVQMLRNAAQGAEAAKILQQLTPDGQLAGIMDVLQGINTAIDKLNKQGKGVTEIKLPDELLNEYRRQTSEEGRNSVVDKMAKSVASQMRVTALDRWTAIRYLNMLGNFKTQIRNVVGNTVMQVANFVKDELAGAMDAMVNRDDRTTSAAWDSATFKEVWKLYKNYAADIEGGGRYNDSTATGFLRQVEDVNKVFGRTGFAAWDKTGGRILEGARFGTNFAMREGDAIFSRFAFAMSVARFMKANNTTWSQAKEPMRVRAINKAIQDAAETTYHDNNVLSLAMSRAFRSETTPAFFKVLAEGILPFRKTPANILMRAYEYSPLSLIEDAIKTIQYERAKAGKGKVDLAELNITGGDLVNRWAKTLTGTGLVILGFFLASWGLLRGKKSDDKNEAELQEQIGYQAYSIKVGNKYITFDWAAPACIPLFLGANLCDAMGSNGLTLKDATTALLRVADPLISMSMLQGINDSLENAATYGTDSALGSFVVNAVWSYFSQGLTNTLLGQAERSWSNQRMQTYVDKNSWMPDQLQRFVGKSSAKVPGWDYNQIPYVDAWGNIEENADTEGWNIANQFLFPWYRKEYDKNAILTEVERLYNSTGDGGVVLTRPGKNFKIQITDENGNPIYDDKGNPKTETLDLSPDQYVTFAMTRGQIATRIVSDLLESDAYKAMSDADKAKTLKAVYSYATGIGAKTVDDHHSINSTLGEALQGYQDFGIPESTYYTAWTTLNQISGYKDAKGDTVTNSSGILKAEALDQMYPNLTKEQRDYLLEALGVGKTVRGWNKNLIAAKAKGLRNQYGG